jgi:hypothetical protein
MDGHTPTDGRVLVLESESRRYDAELKDINKRLQTLEYCTNAIPRIEEVLKDVVLQLKALNECKLVNETTAKSKSSFWESLWGQRLWDIIRAGAIVIVTLLFAINQHLLGAS